MCNKIDCGKTIILDNSGYQLVNLGDVAMLQIAVRRIFEYFPDAKIYIFTYSPQNLEKYCPGTIPLPVQYRSMWMKARILPIPMRLIPKLLRKSIGKIENSLKLQIPLIAHWLMKVIHKLIPYLYQEAINSFKIIRDADVVITSGGGFITDHFHGHANSVLDTLFLAQRLHKETAMFGQGIGPLENELLIKKAQKVFPKLRILGLREGLTSLEYAKLFNTPTERINVTGDDAIEVVLKSKNIYENKKCIGVNIRLANYAGTFQHLLPDIGKVLKEISKSHHAPIIPVPVYIREPNSDLSSVTQICDLDELEYQLGETIISPEDLIRQINRCKVVLTGSYHAGVFALASGIPVVALVGSDYYLTKFSGLAHQFEVGCTLVQINSSNLFVELRDALENAIRSRKDIESKLFDRSHHQIELSRKAWAQFLTMK